MSGGRRRRGAGDGRDPRPVAADRDADPYSVARGIVLNQLSTRARSRAELQTKLASRNVPDEVATEVLDRMEQIDLVDDGAFARDWVRSRHQSRGLAGRALTAELRRKGVDDEVTRTALEELDPDTEMATARELVLRRMRATRGLDREVRIRRMAGMLARKGYPGGMAMAVVRDALAAEGQEVEDLLPE